MAELYMVAAGAGRRTSYFKQVTKLLDTQIDQALVYVQTRDIDNPAVYNTTCLTLSRHIETAIAMNAIPSPSHLPKLLLIVKEAGDGPSEAEFYIAPNTLPDQNVWLLVARTDNMETAACLASPPNVDFLINDSEVPNRTRRKMGKGAQLPTNVTKMVKDGANRLQVIGKFDGEYVIAVAIMSLVSSPYASQLQDYVHPMSDNDCFFTNGPSRILLDCPISGRRIRTPVKGHLCTHSQCFDYNYFMGANFLRPLWKCPVTHCNRPICNLDIRIDRTFLKILNEVADDVIDVYISDDGSWTVSLTEKSQINKDTINRQNHVPGDTEDLASLKANETPIMSSLELQNIGGSSSHMTVECASTFEQPSVTTPGVSLEAIETPHMSSSVLHNIGRSVIQCPTFEQPAVTMPVVSSEANKTPPMSSALHNIGGFVIECPSTSDQPNVTKPAVFLEANETPPMSSDFHSIGDPSINMTVECPSTFEQANVTTPEVNPPQVVKDSLLMPQSSCEMVHTPPLVQQTRPDLNPTATQVPAQAICQNSQTLTNKPSEADNHYHAIQSSCDVVHTPPPTQQTRPNPNPTASHLPAQTQPQNSQTQTDQPTEADNGTCTGNHARLSHRVRRTTVFTPVLLTPPSAARVLRKLERQPRSTTDEAQGTTLVTPAIQKRGRKQKITTVPAVGTEAQGTTLVTPVIKKKRGRKPKIPTNPAVGWNVPQVSPTHVPEVTGDEMSSVGMRGGLTGKDREAALLKYLAPPIQAIHADKPWPEPTTTVPVELLMKEGNINHPRDLPQ